jgi:putative SOS response-associated peptidase YedK
MCGRAVRNTPSGKLAQHFSAEDHSGDLAEGYNIGPAQDLAAVRKEKESDKRELVSLYWGLIPSWVKDEGKRPLMLNNAKAETVHEKRSFKSAFKRRRCIVVFDGFYEWLREDKKNKRPHYFTRKDHAPIAMAGLWEYNKNFDLESGTVLTTSANQLMSQVHTRMPVILASEDEQRMWLDEDADEPALLDLLRPCDPDLLEVVEVSKYVNNVKNKGEECIAPLTDEAEG